MPERHAQPAALVDLRSEAEFAGGHFPGAVNLPAGQLLERTHELPQADRVLRVFCSDAAQGAQAVEILRRRGHPVEVVPLNPTQLTERGPSNARLWEPNAFLIDALTEIENRRYGRSALDVACGSGRDAVFLALRGWEVFAIDILPDALARARDLARRNGVAIMTERHDLEANAFLPSGQFDLIVVFRYLHRPLFGALREAVAEGGYIVYETFHERTLETGRRPRNPEHLLRTGELSRAFAGFELLVVRDAVECDGRYVSSLLARRPAT